MFDPELNKKNRLELFSKPKPLSDYNEAKLRAETVNFLSWIKEKFENSDNIELTANEVDRYFLAYDFKPIEYVYIVNFDDYTTQMLRAAQCFQHGSNVIVFMEHGKPLVFDTDTYGIILLEAKKTFCKTT